MFAHAPGEPFPPRYNIAPTQPIHIVRTGAAGARELVLVRWGLIPVWAKEPAKFSTLINARSETALEKPSFRSAMRHKRCLIPATGYYEWTGEKGHKRPHLFQRPGGALFAFAGLYDCWLGADGSEIESAAILTVAANTMASAIHDRMPAILPSEHFDVWLDCRRNEGREVAPLLRPPPEDALEVFEVDRALNNPRNDGPELQTRVRTTLI